MQGRTFISTAPRPSSALAAHSQPVLWSQSNALTLSKALLRGQWGKWYDKDKDRIKDIHREKWRYWAKSLSPSIPGSQRSSPARQQK